MCHFGVEVKEKQIISTHVRNNIVKGADFIKIASDPRDTEAFKRIPNPAFDDETINTIVESAKKENMNVACHTYPSQEGVKRALCAGVRTIEHAVPIDKSMKKDLFPNTYYVPTFVAAVDDCGISRLFHKEKIKSNILHAIEDFTQNEEKFNGKIADSIEDWFNILLDILPNSFETEQLLCIGSDAGCKGTNFSSAIREILLLSAMGASNSQVLKYAITNPCKALNLSDRGTIKENFIADLVILKKNPISDITTLLCNVAVVCRGNLINNKFNNNSHG